jgi:phospholipid-binding lipoprotein MlaA
MPTSAERTIVPHRLTTLAALVAVLALVACGPARLPQGVQDKYEAQNRLVHQANTDIDRMLLKPASNAYGGGLPEPVRQGIGHFAGNVDLPRSVVNNVLQGRFPNAVHNTLRFVVNTTVGLGGLFDPATGIGLEARDTDFGETLHVWGVGEGNYVELPFLGPSTERDTVGTGVDLFLNPLSYILPSPEKYSTTVANGLSKVGDRYTYGSTVDSVLYDSADSYAQARILYLEYRRFQLRKAGRGGAGAEDDYFDPYADEALSVNDDQYIDPYEDLQ